MHGGYAGAIAEREKPRSSLAGLLPQSDLSETLYGTVLVTAVLVGVSEGGYSIGEMESAVLVTAAVFATAHAWALAMEASAESHQPFRLRSFGRWLVEESAMVRVTAPTVVALGLAWAGAYSTDTGVDVAIVANLTLLFVWGAALDRRAGSPALHAVWAGAAAAALGGVLVVLKVLVH